MNFHSSLNHTLRQCAVAATALTLSATLLANAHAAEYIYTPDGADGTIAWPGQTVQHAQNTEGNHVTVNGVDSSSNNVYAVSTGFNTSASSEISGNILEINTSNLQASFAVSFSTSKAPSSPVSISDNHTYISNNSKLDNAYGIYSFVEASATGNTITVTDSEVSSVMGADCSEGGDVAYNVTTLKNSTAKWATGARTFNGSNATNNTVIIENSTVQSWVQAGKAFNKGNATNNTIILDNANLPGTVVAGGTVSSGGRATDNDVILRGKQGNLSGAMIYGGYTDGTNSSSTDCVTGNTLTLDNFQGSVDFIRNFDTINVNLDSWESDQSLLTIIDGRTSNIGSFTLNIDIASLDAEIEAGERMLLVTGLNNGAELTDYTVSMGGLSLRSSDAPIDVFMEKNAAGTWDLIAMTNGNSFGAIPEPATATLSLMALAALAARRRRM